MVTINAAVVSCALCLAFGALLGILWGCLTASSHETRGEERLSGNDLLWWVG
jgi:hypothetical protein